MVMRTVVVAAGTAIDGNGNAINGWSVCVFRMNISGKCAPALPYRVVSNLLFLVGTLSLFDFSRWTFVVFVSFYFITFSFSF